MNVFSILRERGFVDNTTHEEELNEYLKQKQISCYIGFDPTAFSLHIGSLVPIMSLAHMQRCGHKPIALVGGGTGLIGDPSGKTKMRKLLTYEDIEENKKGIKKQLSRFLDFKNEKAIWEDNARWLTKLKYINFLRDIGKHFSVNRMIKTESCKLRLNSDEGLSFIEFNYMLLQAYDFFELFEKYNCRLQMGGSDQWGNIVQGIELIRKMSRKKVFGITFPLITTRNGTKMGKTSKGAVWLDPERTPPYEYYQFWINTDDTNVARFLALFTFIPMKEINLVKTLNGSDLNAAKVILAFETTKLAHGLEEAVKAYQSAISMFGVRKISENILPSSLIPRNNFVNEDLSVPKLKISKRELNEGIPVFKMFFNVGLTKSGGSARKLIDQGGAYMNGEQVKSFDYLIGINDFKNGEILLRAGKKRYYKIVLE